jgi:hypothetical protein
MSIFINCRYFDTTQKVDFQPPYPYTSKVIEYMFNQMYGLAHYINHICKVLDFLSFYLILSFYLSKLKTPDVDDPYEYNSSPLWKKCHSQFTDVDDYRHCGNNTWHNQSGCYANNELRTTVVPKTDTIPSRLL